MGCVYTTCTGTGSGCASLVIALYSHTEGQKLYVLHIKEPSRNLHRLFGNHTLAHLDTLLHHNEFGASAHPLIFHNVLAFCRDLSGTNKREQDRQPDSFRDLNDQQETRTKMSWDEFKRKGKKSQSKKKTAVYSKKTVKSTYKKKYRASKYEKETDAMLFGGGRKRKNKRGKKKKQKVQLKT